MTNNNFSLLVDASFWLLFSGLLSFFFSIAMFRNVAEVRFSNRKHKVLSLFTISALLAFSLSLLSPFIVSIITNSFTQTPELPLAAYSLIATLLVSYSLHVITSFEKKEEKLRERMDELDTTSASLVENEKKQRKLLESNNLLYEFLQVRTSSYFSIMSRLNEIEAKASEDELTRRKFMDLKLIQIILTRNSLNEVCFDVHEILTILKDIPARIDRELSNLVKVYLDHLIVFYRQKEVDDEEEVWLERLEKQIEEIRNI